MGRVCTLYPESIDTSETVLRRQYILFSPCTNILCPHFISANHERVGQQAHNYSHLHMQFYQRVPFLILPGIRPSLALSACLLSVHRFLRSLCLTASHPGCPQRSGGADLQQSAHPQMLSPMEAAHWRVVPSGGQQPGRMPGCLHSPRRQDLETIDAFPPTAEVVMGCQGCGCLFFCVA